MKQPIKTLRQRVSRKLYKMGWYSQSLYVRDRVSKRAIEEYLVSHCMTREEAKKLIKQSE